MQRETDPPPLAGGLEGGENSVSVVLSDAVIISRRSHDQRISIIETSV